MKWNGSRSENSLTLKSLHDARLWCDVRLKALAKHACNQSFSIYYLCRRTSLARYIHTYACTWMYKYRMKKERSVEKRHEKFHPIFLLLLLLPFILLLAYSRLCAVRVCMRFMYVGVRVCVCAFCAIHGHVFECDAFVYVCKLVDSAVVSIVSFVHSFVRSLTDWLTDSPAPVRP